MPQIDKTLVRLALSLRNQAIVDRSTVRLQLEGRVRYLRFSDRYPGIVLEEELLIANRERKAGRKLTNQPKLEMMLE